HVLGRLITNLNDYARRMRLAGRLHHARRTLAPAAGAAGTSRFHAAGAVVLAAFTTGGLQEFLKQDALQVGLLIAGLVIVFGSRRKDWSGALTVGGIALVGLAVIGMASKGSAIGDFLSGWFWK
ncbi:hypothetical protein LUZ16_29685, partial [Streptomyces albireticuli]